MTQGGPTKVARFGDCGYVRDAQNALGSGRYEHMMSATDPAFLDVLENWLHSRPPRSSFFESHSFPCEEWWVEIHF